MAFFGSLLVIKGVIRFENFRKIILSLLIDKLLINWTISTFHVFFPTQLSHLRCLRIQHSRLYSNLFFSVTQNHKILHFSSFFKNILTGLVQILFWFFELSNDEIALDYVPPICIFLRNWQMRSCSFQMLEHFLPLISFVFFKRLNRKILIFLLLFNTRLVGTYLSRIIANPISEFFFIFLRSFW